MFSSMGAYENYLVRVSCMTYNHSASITDATKQS